VQARIDAAINPADGRPFPGKSDEVRWPPAPTGRVRIETGIQALTRISADQDPTVATVTSRRRFTATVTGPRDTYFDLGEARFLTGANAGYIGQVKRGAADDVLGHFELWDSLPFDLAPGDAVRFIPGCDRRFSVCQSWTHVGEFGNYKRFRGDGFWIPGLPKIQRAPG
jgi:hypothetical protein